MRIVFTIFGSLALVLAAGVIMLTPFSTRDITLYHTYAGGIALVGIGWMIGAVAYRPDPPAPPVPLPPPMPAPGWPAPQAQAPPRY
jgi:hypothetical protein